MTHGLEQLTFLIKFVTLQLALEDRIWTAKGMGKKEEENIRKITEAELAMAHAG